MDITLEKIQMNAADHHKFCHTDRDMRKRPAVVERLETRCLFSASLSLLATFSGAPLSELITDSAGNLYGTTSNGGSTDNGTIFRLSTKTNARWTLASFDGTNGSYPSGGLVADTKGDLFGTTQTGGTDGIGTVFELIAGSHSITALHSFDGSDGQTPAAGLVIDSAGNLFGTTAYGGENNAGTVFKFNAKTHSFTLLTSMNPTLGEEPRSSLVMDSAGDLFGTTVHGGTGGVGTVFKIAARTNAVTTVASFDGSYADSGYLNEGEKSALVIDRAGNLYGTDLSTSTIFKVSAATGAISMLYSFSPTGETKPGISGLTIDSTGNLYGTTQFGGQFNNGGVFKLSTETNHLTTILSPGGEKQFSFYSTMTLDNSGNLYGSAIDKTGDGGAVFKIFGSGI